MDRPNEGEAKDLPRLWGNARQAVFAYVLSLVRDYHDAEDIVQATACAMVDCFDQYDPGRPFVGWVLGIAKLKVFEHWRSTDRRERVFSAATAQRIAEGFVEAPAKTSQIVEALDDCLERLPPRARRTINFHYARNLKPAEIAQQTGMTPHSVRSVLYRIRQVLANCVSEKLRTEAAQESKRTPQ